MNIKKQKRHHFAIPANDFDTFLKKIRLLIIEEMAFGENKFGKFNSAHEAYGVITEEFEEWWDSVKEDNEDPKELIQLIACALRELFAICNKASEEIKKCLTCPHDHIRSFISVADVKECSKCLGVEYKDGYPDF